MQNSSVANCQPEPQYNSGMQTSLFPSSPANTNTMLAAAAVDKGASFSDCGKYRFALWRIWNNALPLVMFIGLNPSTANEDTNDPTIESVIRLSKFNGYGGFYMMNCWSYISTDPNQLNDFSGKQLNYEWLKKIAAKCQDVVFAWGNFKIVKAQKRDVELSKMFPNAKCILKNKNGSPGHPLFKKGTIKFISW